MSTNPKDVVGKRENRRNALHLAALNGHKEIVELLLSHGADINEKDDAGKTALDLAQDSAIIKMLTHKEK